MKLVYCVGIICVLGYIGFCLSGYYLSKKKFFYCLLNFLNSLKIKINYLEQGLEDILRSEKGGSREFLRLIDNYKNLLVQRKINKDQLFCGIQILSEVEKDIIYNFFSSLGRLGMENQKITIENCINVLQEYYQNSKSESNKYGALYTKLGIILGAFISLIII